jgi:hypothetical protein
MPSPWDVHSCDASCPCHTGGTPLPDFVGDAGPNQSKSGRPLGDHRFTIDVFHRTDPEHWEAVVYDLHDHGAQLPYAEITAGLLERALAQATHYVLVAS